VFHRPTVGKAKCLAKTEREIGVLLKECSAKDGKRLSFLLELTSDTGHVDFQLQLDHADEDLKQVSKPELVVRMSTVERIEAAAVSLASATQDSATLHSAGALASSAASLVDHGAQHGDLLSALGTLVARLGNVVDIGTKIGGEIAKVGNYHSLFVCFR
jgi:hypothetical protein